MPVLLARLFLRSRHTPAHAKRWRERLGYYPHASPATRPLWIHAVSVGEAMAAVPLVRALQVRRAGSSPDARANV